MPLPFNIIINNVAFADICDDLNLSPIDKKTVLGIANEYEDGKWQYSKFYRFIWNNIQEDALNKKERDSVTMEPASCLEKAAANLRITDGDIAGGEIAEILLYGIMKNYYNALPVVPKIYYKQNRNDYAKGADSVHIVIEGEDSFSLWLGEAKFYDSIENVRLKEIVESVKNTLSLQGMKKECAIITGLSDLDDFPEINDSLRRNIRTMLKQETSVDVIKPILHIPIMLLYECEITSREKHYTDAYKNRIETYQKNRANAYFKKQINLCKDVDLYSEINFHIILFPVPNKTEIVNSFLSRARNLRYE